MKGKGAVYVQGIECGAQNRQKWKKPCAAFNTQHRAFLCCRLLIAFAPFFPCHALCKAVIDEFVDELRKLGVKVWYDTSEIKWGDSMRARIDDGLKKSRFGVAVLSPDYIKDGKYWTKAELDGLFQLESINGKMLLPVWHNLTKKDVMAYSPIIGSKLAMTTATMTAAEIAAELLSLLPQSEEDR